MQILGEKSERLRTMVQDVFEVSKAASNQLPVNLEKLDLGKLLRQTLADMNVQIAESGLVMRTVIPEAPVMIMADGQRLYRVFQNLVQNALQYSLKGSRIFLTLTDNGSVAVANIKNTSGVELDDGVDFTERFVRGDASRTDGGSGLGLSIARSFTEACGGTFKVELNAGRLFCGLRIKYRKNYLQGLGLLRQLRPLLKGRGEWKRFLWNGPRRYIGNRPLWTGIWIWRRRCIGAGCMENGMWWSGGIFEAFWRLG